MTEHAPVLFNALKHHRGFVQEFITTTSSKELPPDKLRRLLLPIGAAQFDFYTGSLSVSILAQEVQEQLALLNLFNKEAYQAWLTANSGYRILQLSDTSLWTLRMGKQDGYWVHLHPARYSPHSLRLKAPVLKTAIALLVQYPSACLHTSLEVALVNKIRTTLQLPPLRTIASGSQLSFVLSLLSTG